MLWWFLSVWPRQVRYFSQKVVSECLLLLLQASPQIPPALVPLQRARLLAHRQKFVLVVLQFDSLWFVDRGSAGSVLLACRKRRSVLAIPVALRIRRRAHLMVAQQ